MIVEEMRKIIEGAITEHCEGGDLYLCSLIAAQKIEKATAPEKHYPEKWGPSDAKRLTCVCCNPDPFHMTPNVAIEGPEQAQLANGPARMEG